MKLREKREVTRLRDAATMKRRQLGIIFCWSLVLSVAHLPGGGKAFADGDTDSSRTDTGSNGDKGSRDPHMGGANDDDGRDGEANQSQSEARNDTDQENAREAVTQGRVLPLKTVLAGIDADRYGTVIAVDLRRYKGEEVYRLKTRDGLGVIHELRINAQTGKFMNIFGF
jgi:hypothetical protein